MKKYAMIDVFAATFSSTHTFRAGVNRSTAREEKGLLKSFNDSKHPRR